MDESPRRQNHRGSSQIDQQNSVIPNFSCQPIAYPAFDQRRDRNNSIHISNLTEPQSHYIVQSQQLHNINALHRRDDKLDEQMGKIKSQTAPAGAEQTSSRVELSISCANLPDCDIVTKSDPQVIVYQLGLTGQDQKCEIGRTEVIQDNLNPRFSRKILMQYHFEQIQKLRFEVLDIDPVGGNDFLGALDTTLAEIVAERSTAFKRTLTGGPRRRKPAYIIIDVEELVACKQVATFNMNANDLPPICCGLFNPSATICINRSNENGSFTIIHRSQPARRTTSPNFGSFKLPLVSLCNGDLDRSIRFEVIDQRFNMERYFGFFETNVNSLKQNKQAQVFNLLRGKNATKLSDGQSKVVMTDFKIINQATFFDYIRAGSQIHFMISIDFTASNGDPAYSDSLHYIDPLGRQMNSYEAALLAVGRIIKPYDTSGLFAGFGFGAKLHGPNHPPSHLFPLNGNDLHPYVTSLEELLDVYKTKVRSVVLSGPTNFAPCILHCSHIARQFDDGNHYFVLLIVTDGIISDMVQTKRAIIESSKTPMSIIICGVGNADFSAMKELDSDDVVMTLDGKTAERDIVQFVPMNQFLPSDPRHGMPSAPSMNTTEAQRLLAEEVLREIPDQLTGYMLSHGFHPELTHTVD